MLYTNLWAEAGKRAWSWCAGRLPRAPRSRVPPIRAPRSRVGCLSRGRGSVRGSSGASGLWDDGSASMSTGSSLRNSSMRSTSSAAPSWSLSGCSSAVMAPARVLFHCRCPPLVRFQLMLYSASLSIRSARRLRARWTRMATALGVMPMACAISACDQLLPGHQHQQFAVFFTQLPQGRQQRVGTVRHIGPPVGPGRTGRAAELAVECVAAPGGPGRGEDRVAGHSEEPGPLVAFGHLVPPAPRHQERVGHHFVGCLLIHTSPGVGQQHPVAVAIEAGEPVPVSAAHRLDTYHSLLVHLPLILSPPIRGRCAGSRRNRSELA